MKLNLNRLAFALTLCGLLTGVTPALAANWVMASPRLDVPLLVDTESIKASGDVRYAWQSNGRDTKEYVAIKCAERTISTLAGEMVLSGMRMPVAATPFSLAKPGAPIAGVVDFVCNWPTPSN